MAEAPTPPGFTSRYRFPRSSMDACHSDRLPGRRGGQTMFSRPWSVNDPDWTPAPLKVLVFDDHPVYRLGLRAALSDVEDMVLVGECWDPLLIWTDRLRTCPDVLVLSHMRSGESLDIVRHFITDGIGVIFLCERGELTDALSALQAGAHAYLQRDVTTEVLLETIRAVALHEAVMPNDAARQSVPPPAPYPFELTSQPGAVQPVMRGLTARQREVARLVADGLSNAEVAAALYISQATVKSHLTIILKRLNLRDRTQLAILVSRDYQVDASPPTWT